MKGKKYGVWCQVSGGITGYRYGWLKHRDKRVEFERYNEACMEAHRLNSVPKPIRRALFVYSVKELEGEQL